jgi:hypothetical protein
VSEITDEQMLEMLTATKAYTLMVLRQGPNYDAPGRDQIVWEHGRRNFELRADGKLAIVCPVVDDSSLCGIGVFDATAVQVAEIMDGDPGVQAGVFEYEVHPVRGFPGSTLPA